MDSKTYRAQETRFRFLSVTTFDNACFMIELKNRTEAQRFAEHLMATRAARKVENVDKNHVEHAAWATMKKSADDPFNPTHHNTPRKDPT